jgi:hypothetical protein
MEDLYKTTSLGCQNSDNRLYTHTGPSRPRLLRITLVETSAGYHAYSSISFLTASGAHLYSHQIMLVSELPQELFHPILDLLSHEDVIHLMLTYT